MNDDNVLLFELLKKTFGVQVLSILKQQENHKVIKLSKEKALDTYSIRYYALESRPAELFYGYKELLQSLAAYPKKHVLIHSLMGEKEATLIFTSEDNKTLIGYISHINLGK